MPTIGNLLRQINRLWVFKIEQNYHKALVLRRWIETCPWWRKNCDFVKRKICLMYFCIYASSYECEIRLTG